jgi:hypothetical protein
LLFFSRIWKCLFCSRVAIKKNFTTRSLEQTEVSEGCQTLRHHQWDADGWASKTERVLPSRVRANQLACFVSSLLHFFRFKFLLASDIFVSNIWNTRVHPTWEWPIVIELNKAGVPCPLHCIALLIHISRLATQRPSSSIPVVTLLSLCSCIAASRKMARQPLLPCSRCETRAPTDHLLL